MSEAPDPKHYAEEEIKLKKRARRRLIGATVLVLAAVVVLPWILQSEPKPVSSDIEVSIPSQDKDGFRPKVVAVPDASSQKPVEKTGMETPLAVKPEPSRPAEATPVVKPVPATVSDQGKSPAPAPVEVKAEKIKEPPRAEAQHKEKTETAPKEPRSETKADAKAEKLKAEKALAEKARLEKAQADKAKAEKARAEKAEKADKTEKADKADKAEKSEKADRGYIVQVGAFIDAAKARSTQAQIAAAGQKSYTETVETDRGTVTRVRAGPFPSKEKAEAARARLQLEGLSGKVVPR